MKHLINFFLISLVLSSCGMTAKEQVIATIDVNNPSAFDRTIETVTLPWDEIKKEGLIADSVIIIDIATGEELPSQVINNEAGDVLGVIFQTQLLKGETKQFKAVFGTPKAVESKAFGAVFPDRYNDLSWENDVIAYRVYNEKLVPIDGPSGGVDVWSKRTRHLIVTKWYKDKHYHTDHGEGCDHYKVGPSLGAGGLGFIFDGKLIQHSNYVTENIIENGPIRFEALLTFPEVTLGDKTVSFTKRITLDAGQNLNKYELTFSEAIPEAMIATGIILRGDKGNKTESASNTYAAYWQPKDPKHDFTGVGVVSSTGVSTEYIDNHMIVSAPFAKEFTYYSGACWSKADLGANDLASPNTEALWVNYLQTIEKQVSAPLQVKVTKL